MDENLTNGKDENLTDGFQRTDKETGEHWFHQLPERREAAGDKPQACPIVSKCCNKLNTTLNRWKIPKEHSKLGLSSSLLSADNSSLRVILSIIIL